MNTTSSVSCMTSGERLVACLTGRAIDRVPFGVGLGWHPLGETSAQWLAEADPGLRNAQGRLDVGRLFAYDPDCVRPDLEYGPFPRFPVEVLADEGATKVWRDERGIVRRDRKDGTSMSEFLRHPVATPAEWEAIKRERFQISAARIREDWPAFRARLQRDGLAVQVGCFPWGVFGTLRDLMGAEECLIAFYDQPDLVRDIMQTCTDLWLWLYDQVAAEVPIAHIHIWEDMAGRQGSLISPAMVREFMMPCYDRIVAWGRAHGVPVISVDSDGDVADLVPVFVEHGITMMFPFEVQAGCDILTYRRQYPDLAIVGGLDKRVIGLGRAAIDHEVERAARMCEQGRYIPGFDHFITPCRWADWQYAVERLRRVCDGLPLG